jgi:hypothetical protein
MSDQISNPLLALVREQGLVDDLQYEEVVAELKRSGNTVFQISAGLRDHGRGCHPAGHGESSRRRGHFVERSGDSQGGALNAIPGNSARMYRCLPVSLEGTTLQVAFEDPLDPAKIDELGFVAKKDIQLVLAAPAEILAGPWINITAKKAART